MSLGFAAIVSGRVQGVGYRFFVFRAASRLGLSGYVRNLPNGSVEVSAAGSAAALDALTAELRKGPAGANVRSVNLDWSRPHTGKGPFEVRA